MITVNTITAIVAEYYRVQQSDIYTTRRFGEGIKCKHISIYLVNRYMGLTLTKIGKEFPGRNGYLDHATITYALKAMNNRIETDRIFRDEMKELMHRVEDQIPDIITDDFFAFQENDFYLTNNY